MALIFTSEPGIGTVLTEPNLLPMTITLGAVPPNIPWDAVGMEGMRAVIQGISVASEGNHQFLHTIRNYTYVYVFGEKMGDITITGATVMGRYGQDPQNPDDMCMGIGPSGTSQVISYYANNAISATGNTVAIQIGLAAFAGFLTGFSVGIVDPKSLIGQFQLNFKSIAS